MYCRLIYMGILPLVHENNLTSFVAAHSLVKITIFSMARLATPYGTYVHVPTPQLYNKDV